MTDTRNVERRPITIHIPPNADVRLTVLPPCVVVAPAGALAKPGTVSAVLSHDAGVTWPDRRGHALAAAVLAAGGGVTFAFETLADAFACRARLLREAVA